MDGRLRLAVRHWGVAILVVAVALALATAMVVRLSATLASDSSSAAPVAGEVDLVAARSATDPVFERDRVLEPGESIQSCLALQSDSSGVNKGVTLSLGHPELAVANPLAARLQLTIERGSGTFATGREDGSCRGFRAEELVASDTLAGVLAEPSMPVWRPPAGDVTTHFRFTARLAGTTENELQDHRVDGIDLTFVATAEDGSPVWVDSASVLLNSLARRGSLPLVALLALAVLLSAIQSTVVGGDGAEDADRSDTRTFEPPSLA